MFVIFQVLGTPSDDDQSFILDPLAVNYIKALPPAKKLDYKGRFPHASNEAVDLLDKILTFNPYFRISVDDALHHKFFESIHNPSMEVSSCEVDLEFDHVEVEKTMSRDKIRELILEEVKIIKKMIAEHKIWHLNTKQTYLDTKYS